MKIKYFLIFLSMICTTSLLSIPLADYVQDNSLNKEASTKKQGYLRDEYLTEFTNPWEEGDPEEKIEFLFQEAELSALVDYFSMRFNITFILDDALSPFPQGGKSILGSKISFTTNKAFSKKEAWGIFTSYLDLAGLTVIPGPSPRVFKIAPTDKNSPLSPGKNPLPLFIDTGIDTLPADDTPIRYIVFIKNTSIDTIINVINEIKSVNSPRAIVVPDMRAVILTDKSSNIRNMLAIVNELDQEAAAETMQILKLDRIDATKAVNIYKDLIKNDEPSLTARLLGQRKKPNTQYFSENVRLIPAPHINSVVILGTKLEAQKTYDFIKKVLDDRSETSHNPIFTYPLRHTNAEEIARILNAATKFQMDSEAAKFGGVRDGDKFFKPVYIEAEKSGNRLIIYADYEDYTKIFNLIKKIDIEQPQVAIKVLLLNIDLSENKELGAQLRNRVNGGGFDNNINFQTSGLAGTGSPIIENPEGTGANRLLGDLIKLATLSGNVGSTLLTLGADVNGVWGLFKILESYTKASVVSNPFLITTNKYPAQISVGQIRRVLDSLIQNGGATSTDAFKDMAANLTINITPQISNDGLITLDVLINFEQFTTPESTAQTDVSGGNRTRKNVNTSVIMRNNEVLALGGLIQDSVEETTTKVPILGDIPILGNLFKNTRKSSSRTSLLVLILPEIIPTHSDEIADKITEDKILDTKEVYYNEGRQRDPLLRWFFKDKTLHGEGIIDEFIVLKDKYIDKSQYDRINKPVRLKKTKDASLMEHFQEEESSMDQKQDPQPSTPAPSAQVIKMAEARFGSIDEKKQKDEKDEEVEI